jgi:cytochrome P450
LGDVIEGAERAGIDLTDLGSFADGPPLEAYRRLRDLDPVHWHEPTASTPGGEGFWCLTRHADVARAAADPRLSSCTGGERDGGGTLIEDLPLGFAAGVLFNMQDDPRHQHIRRLVTPALSPRRLREIEVALADRCDAILDEAVERGRFDALVDVAAELPLQAIAELLGVPQEDRHRLLAWADATLDYDDREPGQTSERSQQAAAEMFEYGTGLLAAKRRCPADDLLSTIATAQLPPEAGRAGPLDELEQQMSFNLLIAAGSETTRNSIAAGLLALIGAPDQWRDLQADPSLLPGAVEEVLRWASSTIYNRRTATTELVMGERAIAPGDKVVLWWQSANFDERTFDDPEHFDIKRSPNPHLAFGLGPHFCLGANLARLEIRLVLGGLAQRGVELALDGPVVRTRSNKHQGFRSVPVRVEAARCA